MLLDSAQPMPRPVTSRNAGTSVTHQVSAVELNYHQNAAVGRHPDWLELWSPLAMLQRVRQAAAHCCLWAVLAAAAVVACCVATAWAGLLSELRRPELGCLHHAPVQAPPKPVQIKAADAGLI